MKTSPSNQIRPILAAGGVSVLALLLLLAITQPALYTQVKTGVAALNGGESAQAASPAPDAPREPKMQVEIKDTNPPKAIIPGTIDESERPLPPKEKKIAEILIWEGKDVKSLPEDHSQPGRKADVLVDGKRTELKTVEKPNADDATIKNKVNESIRKEGQARDIIIDAQEVGLTREEAERGLIRLGGLPQIGDKLDSVRIIGDGFDITGSFGP